MKQKPFTAEQRARLLSQWRTENSDNRPLVKFFCPWGGATWLISELHPDGDIMFGLCDLGHGTPELGYVSLNELKCMRGPWGLTIERDLHFRADKSIVAYADEARALGRTAA